MEEDEEVRRVKGGVFGRCPVSPVLLWPSPSLSEPDRKWQQQHSQIFSLLFFRTDANITCVSSLWRSGPHR